MKKVIVFAITIAIVSLFTFSANAQEGPTGARPGKPTAVGHSIKTLGQFSQESVEVKSDGKGSLDFWRLTGLSFNGNVGMVKDGLAYNVGAAYQLRIPKAPWTRCFIIGANIGSKQIEIDGLKKGALYAEGTLMVDLMTLIAPKSRIVFNVGGGYSWTKVKYTSQLNIEDQYLVGHQYSASSGGPVVKVEVGYDFDRRFSLVAGATFNTFGVERAPLEKINYSSAGFFIGAKIKIGRK